MKALILGFVVIITAVLAALPSGLGWKDDVLAFLRGSLPVAAVFISLILIFVGIADIKDRAAAKKEKMQKDDS
ncbi:MAG: hypothetical protein FWC64_00370 [Treponema sp.]|nr:hypothetical protein [Treponema sp.]